MSTRIVVGLIAAFCPVTIHAQEKLTAAGIVEKAQAAFYSPGLDMKADADNPDLRRNPTVPAWGRICQPEL